MKRTRRPGIVEKKKAAAFKRNGPDAQFEFAVMSEVMASEDTQVIWCGPVMNRDYHIVCIDFDILPDLMVEFVELLATFPYAATQPIVRSGGGGFHVYFLVESPNNLMNMQNVFEGHPWLKGLDVKVQGGVMFGPGSRFVNHGMQPYEAINIPTDISEISVSRYSEIYKNLMQSILSQMEGTAGHYYLEPQFNSQDATTIVIEERDLEVSEEAASLEIPDYAPSEATNDIEVTNTTDSLLYDIGRYAGMQPVIDMINGKYQIEHAADNEFRYWIMFYRFTDHVFGTAWTDSVGMQFADRQAEFDESESKRQLKNVRRQPWYFKPITSRKVKELFNVRDKRTQVRDELSEIRDELDLRFRDACSEIAYYQDGYYVTGTRETMRIVQSQLEDPQTFTRHMKVEFRSNIETSPNAIRIDDEDIVAIAWKDVTSQGRNVWNYRPADIITFRHIPAELGTAIDVGYETPNWNRFVSGLGFSDKDIRRLEDTLFGLISNQFKSNKRIALFVGRPNTGKSTILKILHAGMPNCVHFLDSGMLDYDFTSGYISGNSILAIDDVHKQYLSNSYWERIKRLSGGVPFSSNRKNKDITIVNVTFSLAITSNRLFATPASSRQSTIARFVLFEFLEVHETDAEFEAALLAEAPFILANLYAKGLVRNIDVRRITCAPDSWSVDEDDLRTFISIWDRKVNPTQDFLESIVEPSDGKDMYVDEHLIARQFNQLCYRNDLRLRFNSREAKRAIEDFLATNGIVRCKKEGSYVWKYCIKTLSVGVSDF